MDSRGIRTLAAMVAALALAVGVVAGGGVIAQDAATPAASPGEVAHPAHIHTGTCATLGDVVYPLNDLVPPGTDGSPMATSDVGTPEAGRGEVVAESTTTVTTTFDEILGAEHAINVHESAENIGLYIACGDLAGTPSAEGDLEIDLEEQNESGLEGMATLHDNGDGTIEVHAVLWQVADGGTPVASPTT